MSGLFFPLILVSGLSVPRGTPASGHAELPAPAATRSAAEDHLSLATVDRPVIVEARIDSICRPREPWRAEGPGDGRPCEQRRLCSPIRIAPIEYWRGEGPATPYLVCLEGGCDPVNGEGTFMRPFAPRWLKTGRVVVLFLSPALAGSIRDPSPGPASPVDPVDGIPFVAAGDGYWLDDEYAYADPVGRDSPLEHGRMPLRDFRSIIGRMAACVAPDSLSARGSWTEVTVLAASTTATRGGPRILGRQVLAAQRVRARVIWPESAAGDTVTFFNPTKLATGREGMAKKDPWAEHLRPVGARDHRLVCLQEWAGEKWVIGGENGVLGIADGGVRLWSVAADGRLVNGPVPLPEMRTRLARRGLRP